MFNILTNLLNTYCPKTQIEEPGFFGSLFGSTPEVQRGFCDDLHDSIDNPMSLLSGRNILIFSGMGLVTYLAIKCLCGKKSAHKKPPILNYISNVEDNKIKKVGKKKGEDKPKEMINENNNSLVEVNQNQLMILESGKKFVAIQGPKSNYILDLSNEYIQKTIYKLGFNPSDLAQKTLHVNENIENMLVEEARNNFALQQEQESNSKLITQSSTEEEPKTELEKKLEEDFQKVAQKIQEELKSAPAHSNLKKIEKDLEETINNAKEGTKLLYYFQQNENALKELNLLSFNEQAYKVDKFGKRDKNGKVSPKGILVAISLFKQKHKKDLNKPNNMYSNLLNQATNYYNEAIKSQII